MNMVWLTNSIAGWVLAIYSYIKEWSIKINLKVAKVCGATIWFYTYMWHQWKAAWLAHEFLLLYLHVCSTSLPQGGPRHRYLTHLSLPHPCTYMPKSMHAHEAAWGTANQTVLSGLYTIAHLLPFIWRWGPPEPCGALEICLVSPVPMQYLYSKNTSQLI